MSDPTNMFYNHREDEQNKQQETTSATPPKSDGKPSEQEVQDKLSVMKELAAKYQKEGEGQLINDILNNVLEQKARGQLNNDQLIAFARRVTPLLNSDQRNRLNQLLEQLLKL